MQGKYLSFSFLIFFLILSCKPEQKESHLKVTPEKKTLQLPVQFYPKGYQSKVLLNWIENRSLRLKLELGKSLTILDQSNAVIFTGFYIGEGTFGRVYGNGEIAIKMPKTLQSISDEKSSVDEVYASRKEIESFRIKKEILGEYAIDYAIGRPKDHATGVRYTLIATPQYDSTLDDLNLASENVEVRKAAAAFFSLHFNEIYRRLYSSFSGINSAKSMHTLFDLRPPNIFIKRISEKNFKLVVGDAEAYHVLENIDFVKAHWEEHFKKIGIMNEVHQFFHNQGISWDLVFRDKLHHRFFQFIYTKLDPFFVQLPPANSGDGFAPAPHAIDPSRVFCPE